MTIGDNRDYIRVLLYSYYTTITGWGVLLRFSVDLEGKVDVIVTLTVAIVGTIMLIVVGRIPS